MISYLTIEGDVCLYDKRKKTVVSRHKNLEYMMLRGQFYIDKDYIVRSFLDDDNSAGHRALLSRNMPILEFVSTKTRIGFSSVALYQDNTLFVVESTQEGEKICLIDNNVKNFSMLRSYTGNISYVKTDGSLWIAYDYKKSTKTLICLDFPGTIKSYFYEWSFVLVVDECDKFWCRCIETSTRKDWTLVINTEDILDKTTHSKIMKILSLNNGHFYLALADNSIYICKIWISVGIRSKIEIPHMELVHDCSMIEIEYIRNIELNIVLGPDSKIYSIERYKYPVCLFSDDTPLCVTLNTVNRRFRSTKRAIYND